MSTRYARTADKALNEKHSAILKALLKKPGNKYCADCKRKDPRWASWNLGIFVCIRCSGIHRSMGTHISKVKSVDLDTWVPEQIENMVRWGNERANKYWEANLKDKRPSENNIDMFIRTKYEQKRWAMKGPVPDPSTLGGDEEESTAQNTSSPVTSQKQPTPKAQSDFVNLDAFLSSPTTTTSQPASSVAQLKGADFFFSNNNNDDSKSNSGSNNNTPQQQQQQEPSKPKHDDIKSSILSLYNQAPSPSVNNGGYLSNMTSYQQQLSGLSMGTGMIPPAPPGHNFSNVWGSFTSTTQQRQTSSSSILPQGSQFFSSSSSTTTAQTTTTTQKKPPAHDVFADLLK